MPRLIAGILISLGILLGFSVNAASFDCSKASTPYEKAVCSNPNLSSLDDQLASAYKDARAKSSNPDGLKKEQIEWIKSTRQCASDAGCIEKAYKSRIATLSGSSQVAKQSSSTPSSPPKTASTPEPAKQWVSEDGLTEGQWIARCQRYESARQACAVADRPGNCMEIKLGMMDKGNGDMYCQNGQPNWRLMGRR
jgi:uncharacterized protein